MRMLVDSGLRSIYIATYGWIALDTELVNPGDKHVTVGPDTISDEYWERLDAGEGEKFLLMDDDGGIMAKGRIIGDYSGFEPLDDFGEGAYGCTGIKYRSPKSGKYEYL